MKYLLLSDLHGSIDSLERVLQHFETMGCDMLLLLGDLLNYGPRNSLPRGLDPKAVAERLSGLSKRIVAVRGNCDSEVDQMLMPFPLLADYALVVDDGRRLFLTHGHIYNEERHPTQGFDVLFCGHSHLQHITPLLDGRVLVNIGSPTFPKGGNPPTFATYEAGIIRIHTLDGAVLAQHSLD